MCYGVVRLCGRAVKAMRSDESIPDRVPIAASEHDAIHNMKQTNRTHDAIFYDSARAARDIDGLGSERNTTQFLRLTATELSDDNQ